MANGTCLACEKLPCTCNAPSELERAHALLAGLIGQRGETIEETIEMVRKVLTAQKLTVTADEIRARHASLEDWRRKVSQGTFEFSGYRVDLAAYRIAVKHLEELS